MSEYTELKRKALESFFERMNEQQQKAVFTVNGPLLILAGAGSGKTTVLINRIANMIYFGNAYYDTEERILSDEQKQILKDFAENRRNDYDKLAEIIAVSPITPWSILAITFTNKAANELKQRLSIMLGESGADVAASTFHSMCVKILRREIEALGYSKSFAIYDTNDSLRVIKDCMQYLEISDKMFPPRAVHSAIGRAKDRLLMPEQYSQEAANDYRLSEYSKIYKEYQKRLKQANAVDFDDIIMLTVQLFEQNPEVLLHYQRLYKYVMVDEYQDTNLAQYKLISLITCNHKNICVVGDDDQSIYKFRGATIENILNFEEEFESCTVIRLEQNYRSTQNILSAANSVIKNNENRKGKSLWTGSGDGEKIEYHGTYDDRSEARFVADKILEYISHGGKYSDNAVLYRTTAQSRAIEQGFLKSGVPYQMVGGMRFLERAEVKDMLSYLSVIDNPNDMLRFKRIINTPKRGIGDATVKEIERISNGLGISPMEVVRTSNTYQTLASKSGSLMEFAAMMDKLSEKANENLAEVIELAVDITGYAISLTKLGFEGEGKLENINELKSYIANYVEENEEPSLAGFLEEVSLYSDLDSLDGETDKVVMMTVHSAKGLEFDNVFIVGFEENIFPNIRALNEGDLEEERRLAYVAITRAKRKLYFVTAQSRNQFGQYSRNEASRFISEIPKEYIERTGNLLSFNAENQDIKRSSKTKVIFNPYEKPVMPKKDLPKNTYAVGERVRHSVFGDGIIVKVTPMSGDAMVEINFDSKITKKIMANYARLEKI